MKLVTYQDSNGYKHKSLIRDNDTDPSIGILQSPPSLEQLDWHVIKMTLHNMLLERGIITLDDAQSRADEFNKCVLTAVAKPLFRLYQQETESNGS